MNTDTPVLYTCRYYRTTAETITPLVDVLITYIKAMFTGHLLETVLIKAVRGWSKMCKHKLEK